MIKNSLKFNSNFLKRAANNEKSLSEYLYCCLSITKSNASTTSTTAASIAAAAAASKKNYQPKNKISAKTEEVIKREDKYG